MAPSDEYGGDSNVDDGFDDDVPGVGGSGSDDQQEEEENPFTSFGGTADKNDEYDDGDSTDDDIEDVTPAQSAASPVEPKYGGSVRKRAAGWGDEGGGASKLEPTKRTWAVGTKDMCTSILLEKMARTTKQPSLRHKMRTKTISLAVMSPYVKTFC